MYLSKHKHILSGLASAGLLLVGLLLLLSDTPQIAHAAPGDLFVTPGGGGNCSQGNPCDPQTALSQAVDGNTLFLAQGTYTGTGGAVITVTKSITLYGGWDGTATTPVVRDPDAYPTTLDGEDARHVVHISGLIAPTIEGLNITGGQATDGGGIYIHDASPLVQYNVITANRTISGGAYDDGRGGGIFVGGNSTAVIAHNHILSNTSGYGGGIYHYGTVTVTINTNEIVGNDVAHRGGGIMMENAPDIIQTNVISGNSAAEDGGAILIWHSAPQVDANRIAHNSAPDGGAIGMRNGSAPDLTNNVFINNSVNGLLVDRSSPVVINNTIVGSGLPGTGDGVYLQGRSGCSPGYCTAGVFLNNIIVSYEVGIHGTIPVTLMIDYNDVWGNTTADYTLPTGVVTGAHNISQDALFSNPSIGDYHLRGASPCVGAGDPAGVPPAPATDIDGDKRPIGHGVDIGADEFVWRHVFLPLVLKNPP